MAVVVKVQGLDTLARQLRRLPENVQRVALVKAVKAAALPIKLRAQALVGKQSGLLASRIEIRFTKRGVQRVGAEIGVFNLKGKKRVKALARATKRLGRDAAGRDIDPYYARWVEYGHRIVTRGVTGLETTRLRVKGGGLGTVKGTVRPHPFLRPALDANRDAAVQTIRLAVNDEINRVGRL